MSLEKGLHWSYNDLNFRGYSMAGIITSLVFDNAKICFDVGPGLPFHMNAKAYCITHCHADHASGINYILTQRALFGLPQAQIYMPVEHADDLDDIFVRWQNIQNFEYDYKIHPVGPNQQLDLNDQYRITAFETYHRIPSRGYILYEKRKKLKAEYENLSQSEIADLATQGKVVSELVEEPLIAFTGDTRIEFMDSHPDILKAKILFMECTYLGDARSPDEARKWGHIHFDEIKSRAQDFQNERVALIHFSSRHNFNEAKEALKEIPKNCRDRFEIFPRPY